jgi:hypothetical protein
MNCSLGGLRNIAGDRLNSSPNCNDFNVSLFGSGLVCRHLSKTHCQGFFEGRDIMGAFGLFLFPLLGCSSSW